MARAQLNHVGALIKLVLHGERVGTLDALKECAGPHDPSNGERPKVVREVKQPVFKFQAADIFTYVNRVFDPLSKSHSTPSHSLHEVSEQLGIGAFSKVFGNLINSVIDGPLLSPRQTENSFRANRPNPAPVSARELPNPANDNDDWREAA